MAMPKGDSPQKVQDYYHYLQAHQLEPHGRVQTWHVDWTSLGWMWGFVAALVIIFFFWIRDYRSTHPQTGIAPLDRWGGYTTDAGGRAALLFSNVQLMNLTLRAAVLIRQPRQRAPL